MATLLPLWSLVLPCWIGYSIGLALKKPLLVDFGAMGVASAGLLLVILLAIFLTAVAEDNRVHVAADGITFPLFMLPRLGFKRHCNWDELREVGLVSADTTRATLLLTMRSGKSVGLRLANIDKSHLEQLLLSVELWSKKCIRTQDVINLQRSLQNEGRATGAIGHTRMWEEELSRRFSATTFLPLEPDSVLCNGSLKVLRQLAFGGLSAIYLAQRNNADLVVLKESVVPANANSDTRAQAEEHLAREAALLAKLEHPSIARVYDHFVEDGRHYLLLEYIHGQDLRQYVKQNGPVNEKTALKWGIALADILEYLHGLSPPIVHRDLTPDNIVLTNDGRLILIDFGAANHFVGNATGTIVGKQAYIPAEQLRGKTVPQSDIYALAGTIQYLLTGKDPVPLAQCNPRKMSGTVSVELDALLAQCTEFEPVDRVQSVALVKEELERIQSKTGAFAHADQSQ